MKKKILIIEDDLSISELIEMNLTVAGYDTKAIYDGREAIDLLEINQDFDLALLDLMLPGADGFQILPRLNDKKIPVICLTARGDIASKVKGLKEGAEDYIVKPFEMLELLVRMEKILERFGKLEEVLYIKDIEINISERIVKKDDTVIYLKPMEFELLITLAKNKNRVLTRDKLLQMVWGQDYLGETRTVDVHIGQLRKKLGFHEEIKSIPKVGYRLEV